MFVASFIVISEYTYWSILYELYIPEIVIIIIKKKWLDSNSSPFRISSSVGFSVDLMIPLNRNLIKILLTISAEVAFSSLWILEMATLLARNWLNKGGSQNSQQLMIRMDWKEYIELTLIFLQMIGSTSVTSIMSLFTILAIGKSLLYLLIHRIGWSMYYFLFFLFLMNAMESSALIYLYFLVVITAKIQVYETDRPS